MAIDTLLSTRTLPEPAILAIFNSLQKVLTYLQVEWQLVKELYLIHTMIKLKSQHPILKLIIASILLCVDSQCLFWVSLYRRASSQQPPSAFLHPTCQWCLHAQQQLRVAGLNSFIVTHLPRGLCCPRTCSSSQLCLPERGHERTCTCHPSCSSPA